MDRHTQFTCIMNEMIHYYSSSVRRVNHFLKVWAFTRQIALCEHVSEDTRFILEIAALMHDIGIKPSEEKYQSSAGRYQELEGPAAARPILEKYGFSIAQTERICYLIAHHHTYTDIEGIDYQILVEADFLVNLYEEGLSRKTAEHVRRQVFRTAEGIRCLETLYLNSDKSEDPTA